MKFRVEFVRTLEWQEEVEVPEDLVEFVNDDHMDMGLTPHSGAKVADWLRKYSKGTLAIPDEDSIQLTFFDPII